MRLTKRNSAAGFTLVELLVVIVILSLLAALSARAVYSAIIAAKRARITIEMSQLAQQFEVLKQQYGSYPPSDPASAAAYVQQMSQHVDAATAATEVAAFTDASEAIGFWLSGISPSPTQPILGAGNKQHAFEFDATRLNNSLYYPPLATSSNPYVYTSGGTTMSITSAGVDDTIGNDDDITIPE